MNLHIARLTNTISIPLRRLSLRLQLQPTQIAQMSLVTAVLLFALFGKFLHIDFCAKMGHLKPVSLESNTFCEKQQK